MLKIIGVYQTACRKRAAATLGDRGRAREPSGAGLSRVYMKANVNLVMSTDFRTLPDRGP